MTVIKKQSIRDFWMLDTWKKLSRNEKMGYLFGVGISTILMIIGQHMMEKKMQELLDELEQADRDNYQTTMQLHEAREEIDALRRLDEIIEQNRERSEPLDASFVSRYGTEL